MNAYSNMIARSESAAITVIEELNDGITIDYEVFEDLDDAGRAYVRREVSVVEVPGEGYHRRVFSLWSATEEGGQTIAHREPLDSAHTDFLRALIAESIRNGGEPARARDAEGCMVTVETHDEYDV